MEKERKVKCAGCRKMKPAVIFICTNGKSLEFCSRKCKDAYGDVI